MRLVWCKLYVRYTLRHLHQHVIEHNNQSSSIGKHFINKHCTERPRQTVFFVLRKCKNKFDCLVHEMLLISELTPSLNVQSDSIRAKLFAWHYIIIYILIFSELFLTVYFNHFKLENGVMTTPKRYSILLFIFTCLRKIDRRHEIMRSQLMTSYNTLHWKFLISNFFSSIVKREKQEK